MVRPWARGALVAWFFAAIPAYAAPPARRDPPGSLPSADLDPSRGRGSRRVAPPQKPGAPAPRGTAATAPSAPAAPKAHQKGRPPKQPAASLPPGALPPSPDPDARRHVAGGPTAEEVAAGSDDPELRALREAERALFPRELPGLAPGWSWELPRRRTGEPEVVTGAPPAASASARPAAPPASPFLQGLVLPNLRARLEERVVRYLEFYRDAPRGKAIGRVWAKKSGRYVRAIEAALAKAGLPSDLVWLSLIESGHNPTIVSPAGAVGLWQFMPEAGRAYGLVIDRWVDERLDADRSTEAACRYLSDLHRRFGSWDLAMAAYNMGYGGLSRAIKKYNTNDFWELSRHEAGLPWETTLYVPKILATAIVMNNRRAFALDDVAPDPAESFDTVLVGPAVELAEIAAAAGVSVASLAEHNPQFLAGRTPPSAPGGGRTSWAVRVPAGKGTGVSEALSGRVSSAETLGRHVVLEGDTLASIAVARGSTPAELQALNAIRPGERLTPGGVLLLPRQARANGSAPGDRVVVVPARSVRYPDRKRVFYRVLPGDALASVARAFGVASSELAVWNALDERARLQADMTLQIFVPGDRDLSQVRCLGEADARVLVAGSREFLEYFEGQNGKNRLVIRARTGDTLAKIGSRYAMPVGSMERVNRRSRRDPVEAGEPMVVYTTRATPAPGDRLFDAAPPARSRSSTARVANAAEGG